MYSNRYIFCERGCWAVTSRQTINFTLTITVGCHRHVHPLACYMNSVTTTFFIHQHRHPGEAIDNQCDHWIDVWSILFFTFMIINVKYGPILVCKICHLQLKVYPVMNIGVVGLMALRLCYQCYKHEQVSKSVNVMFG